jgi:hypothetical protein
MLSVKNMILELVRSDYSLVETSHTEVMTKL